MSLYSFVTASVTQCVSSCVLLFLSVGTFRVGLHLTKRGPVGPYVSVPFGPNSPPNFKRSSSIIVKQPLEVHMPSMLLAFTSPKREPVGTYVSAYLFLPTFIPTNHSLYPLRHKEGVPSIQLIPVDRCLP